MNKSTTSGEVTKSNEEEEISEVTGTGFESHPEYDPDLPENKQRQTR